MLHTGKSGSDQQSGEVKADEPLNLRDQLILCISDYRKQKNTDENLTRTQTLLEKLRPLTDEAEIFSEMLAVINDLRRKDSLLGNSTQLRSKLSELLCRYFGIDESEINQTLKSISAPTEPDLMRNLIMHRLINAKHAKFADFASHDFSKFAKECKLGIVYNIEKKKTPQEKLAELRETLHCSLSTFFACEKITTDAYDFLTIIYSTDIETEGALIKKIKENYYGPKENLESTLLVYINKALCIHFKIPKETTCTALMYDCRKQDLATEGTRLSNIIIDWTITYNSIITPMVTPYLARYFNRSLVKIEAKNPGTEAPKSTTEKKRLDALMVEKIEQYKKLGSTGDDGLERAKELTPWVIAQAQTETELFNTMVQIYNDSHEEFSLGSGKTLRKYIGEALATFLGITEGQLCAQEMLDCEELLRTRDTIDYRQLRNEAMRKLINKTVQDRDKAEQDSEEMKNEKPTLTNKLMCSIADYGATLKDDKSKKRVDTLLKVIMKNAEKDEIFQLNWSLDVFYDPKSLLYDDIKLCLVMGKVLCDELEIQREMKTSYADNHELEEVQAMKDLMLSKYEQLAKKTRGPVSLIDQLVLCTLDYRKQKNNNETLGRTHNLLEALHSPTNEAEAFSTMLAIINNFEETSLLGSSTQLRGKLSELLCRYLGIDESEISQNLKNISAPNEPSLIRNLIMHRLINAKFEKFADFESDDFSKFAKECKHEIVCNIEKEKTPQEKLAELRATLHFHLSLFFTRNKTRFITITSEEKEAFRLLTRMYSIEIKTEADLIRLIKNNHYDSHNLQSNLFTYVNNGLCTHFKIPEETICTKIMDQCRRLSSHNKIPHWGMTYNSVVTPMVIACLAQYLNFDTSLTTIKVEDPKPEKEKKSLSTLMLNKILEYKEQDSPGLDGSLRAKKLIEKVNELQEKEHETKLFNEMLEIYNDSGENSILKNSTKLRDRIGQALAKFLEITEGQLCVQEFYDCKERLKTGSKIYYTELRHEARRKLINKTAQDRKKAAQDQQSIEEMKNEKPTLTNRLIASITEHQATLKEDKESEKCIHALLKKIMQNAVQGETSQLKWCVSVFNDSTTDSLLGPDIKLRHRIGKAICEELNIKIKSCFLQSSPYLQHTDENQIAEMTLSIQNAWQERIVTIDNTPKPCTP